MGPGLESKRKVGPGLELEAEVTFAKKPLIHILIFQKTYPQWAYLNMKQPVTQTSAIIPRVRNMPMTSSTQSSMGREPVSTVSSGLVGSS